jgi:hypothetical protein
MAQESVAEILGKKVFFLFPSAIVQNDVVDALIQQEFEVYISKDPARLQKILVKYPDSVVLVNISEELQEDQWEAWIRKIMTDQATAKVDIGILTPSLDEEQQRKYVDSLKVPGGYIQVKPDAKLLIWEVLETLKAVDAKGRRKYIRATTGIDFMTTLNIPMNGSFIKGVINDISTMGLSCVFEVDPELEKNSLCQSIQIKLQSIILKAEGIVFGSRPEGDKKVYVLVFTQRTDPSVRIKIRKFIHGVLQAKLDAEFK